MNRVKRYRTGFVMEKIIKDDFNLRVIAESGQCFRFIEAEKDTYRIIAFGKVLYLKDLGNGKVDFSCSEKEFKEIWYDYFDFKTNYAKIRKMAEDNVFLKDCADRSVGMRILNQDKWEMTVSFIISQRKSIPAIKTSIERLSKACGDKLGENLYAFPTPEQILSVPTEKLAECGLGYRLDYIKNAADLFFSNKNEFERLNKLTDDDLLSELKKMQGVGDKVASCIALFGFHRLNFFPKDVWINRALEEHFPNGFDMNLYAPFNGVIQQYIFYAYRNSHK